MDLLSIKLAETALMGCKVHFCESVSVFEIPSHRDMGPAIVPQLWTSPEEIEKNCRRNRAEWKWEHEDWTKALEEDQMICDPFSGDYIHPATWEALEIERLEKEREQELERKKLEQAERRRKYFQERRAPRTRNPTWPGPRAETSSTPIATTSPCTGKKGHRRTRSDKFAMTNVASELSAEDLASLVGGGPFDCWSTKAASATAAADDEHKPCELSAEDLACLLDGEPLGTGALSAAVSPAVDR